jgi:DNA mismatch repair ATPase MutS
VNALRFTTPELSQFESKMTHAQSHLFQKEYEVFKEVCQKISTSF